MSGALRMASSSDIPEMSVSSSVSAMSETGCESAVAQSVPSVYSMDPTARPRELLNDATTGQHIAD